MLVEVEAPGPMSSRSRREFLEWKTQVCCSDPVDPTQKGMIIEVHDFYSRRYVRDPSTFIDMLL